MGQIALRKRKNSMRKWRTQQPSFTIVWLALPFITTAATTPLPSRGLMKHFASTPSVWWWLVLQSPSWPQSVLWGCVLWQDTGNATLLHTLLAWHIGDTSGDINSNVNCQIKYYPLFSGGCHIIWWSHYFIWWDQVTLFGGFRLLHLVRITTSMVEFAYVAFITASKLTIFPVYNNHFLLQIHLQQGTTRAHGCWDGEATATGT